MLKIEISDCVLEGNPQSNLEALASISAPLRLIVAREVVVDDDAYPVAELALALKRWTGVGDFVYESIEADLPPLLFIATAKGYFIASPLSGTCSKQPVAAVTLKRCIVEFVDRVELGSRSLGWPNLLV